MTRWIHATCLVTAMSAQDLTAPPEILEPSCCAASSRMAAMSLDLFANQSAWKFHEASAWKWVHDKDGNELQLVQQNPYQPPHRSPKNLAWFSSREWRSFTLTLECKLTQFNQGNNDLCIAFGGSGDNQFYYAHLGEKADDAHHQIHIVNKADRKPITKFRTTGTPWKDDTWHRVKIVRNADSGDIAIWFDDEAKPILYARDSSFEWGKIALGSFDDTGHFRNVKIKGSSRVVTQPSP